ncbi:metal-sensing transcriptional repressor [Paraburkholderia sp. FT54]|uniref:metal-sensing transcriptional repressor n=1 Tax=Paraburkholderia sp. FT54 TaxID=3074437 RepID=UPI0038F6652A
MRLKRAEGHLRSTIAMIEAGQNCAEVAQQLHAIEKTITNAQKALIHDHEGHCLDAQAGADGSSAKAALAEFKEITRSLRRPVETRSFVTLSDRPPGCHPCDNRVSAAIFAKRRPGCHASSSATARALLQMPLRSREPPKLRRKSPTT